jgi:DNA-binding PadR family transcriptional regulator
MSDDFAVLASVAANPTHPYALLEHLQGLGLKTTRSTLYRRVEALVAQGWLQADDIRGKNGHYRRALALTKAGRGRLERECREVLEAEPLESPLFSLAIAATAEPELLARILRPRMASAARRLTHEEASLRAHVAAPGSRAITERRVAHLQADIAWLQQLSAPAKLAG